MNAAVMKDVERNLNVNSCNCPTITKILFMKSFVYAYKKIVQNCADKWHYSYKI